MVTFEFTANAFLQHMVRNLVGTLVAIGSGELAPADAARDPRAPRPPRGRRHGAAGGLDARRSAVSGAVRACRATSDGAVMGRRALSAIMRGFSVASAGMSWFDKLMPSRIRTEKRKHSVPEGLWVKCAGCSAQLYRAELHRNLHVCPKCGHHLRIGARERLEMFLDPESGYELAANLEPLDPLRFKDTKRYRERLNHAQRETDERDALIVMAGTLKSDADRRGRVRVPLHLGLDGLGRRRAVRARRGLLHSASAPARVLLGERRCAHAGSAVLVAADGEDELRARAACGRQAAVRFRDDRSRRRAASRRALRC